MRGLKPTNLCLQCRWRMMSHLLQMRGLKPTHDNKNLNGCGRIFYRCVDWNFNQQCMEFCYNVASFTDAWIETTNLLYIIVNRRVASFTDAWIETSLYSDTVQIIVSHLLQMRGLKLCRLFHRVCRRCRIFYRCVDWNCFSIYTGFLFLVASFTDAWIETWSILSDHPHLPVASFTDAWIETTLPCVWT